MAGEEDKNKLRLGKSEEETLYEKLPSGFRSILGNIPAIGTFGVPLAAGITEGIRRAPEEGFVSGFGRGAGQAGAGIVEPYLAGIAGAGRFAFGPETQTPWETFAAGESKPVSQNYWQTLNTGYVPGSLGGVDPGLVELAQLYSEEQARMAPTLAKAQGQIQSAYGSAAQAGRQAATGIQRRGEQAATGFERLLGEAAQQVGDLSQTGGTAISGLTGPAQGFQDIYGGAYGAGMGEAYGTRQGAGIAAEEMSARAGQAGVAGGRASADLQNYWNNLTSGERKQIGAAMIASKRQREEALNASRAELGMRASGILGAAIDNKKSRKVLQEMLANAGINVPANKATDAFAVTQALIDWAYKTRGVGPAAADQFLSIVGQAATKEQ